MNYKCSKCRSDTEYSGDLHCRKIFIDEIRSLVSLQEFEKAGVLFFESLFDDEWKKEFLRKHGDALAKEVEKARVQKRHQDFLVKLGIPYKGISTYSGPRKHRITGCYKCREILDNSIDVECSNCKWIICWCGACGCGYNVENK